ncbi:hypothetical protein [Aquitalea magnusonii]|uniref:hypothetical protein n=1 Tax=Aquitalea magnusonii TaxID=332411 RepID=UPI0007501045|nr:hypothetical protein [Aquitalea magnusonii]
MTHPDPDIPQAPPLTLYYQGKPVRVLLHHGHCCLLADDILALSPPRLRHQLQQQLAEYPGCALTLPQHDSPQCGWPETALQRALQQSKRPAARQLQHWLQQQVLPALQQLPPDAPRWEQALAMAAEAGQQISHAVLQAVLEHGSDWQHSHWLLTLNYTPSHPRRHAHGRLVALNSSATSLQALAQHIAGPDAVPAAMASCYAWRRLAINNWPSARRNRHGAQRRRNQRNQVLANPDGKHYLPA